MKCLLVTCGYRSQTTFNHIKMCMHCVIHKHNECRLLRSSHAGCPTINGAQMQSVWLWNKFCDRHTVLMAQWESSVTSNHTDYRLPLTDCTDTLMSHVSALQPNCVSASHYHTLNNSHLALPNSVVLRPNGDEFLSNCYEGDVFFSVPLKQHNLSIS